MIFREKHWIKLFSRFFLFMYYLFASVYPPIIGMFPKIPQISQKTMAWYDHWWLYVFDKYLGFYLQHEFFENFLFTKDGLMLPPKNSLISYFKIVWQGCYCCKWQLKSLFITPIFQRLPKKLKFMISIASKDWSMINYCQSLAIGLPYYSCNGHCDWWLFQEIFLLFLFRRNSFE